MQKTDKKGPVQEFKKYRKCRKIPSNVEKETVQKNL